MILGVLVMIILHLGFPKDWDFIILILVGLVIVVVSYSLKPKDGKEPVGKEELPYVDYHSPTEEGP